MIENSFVYAMDKVITKKHKEEAKKAKRIEPMKTRFYNILEKYNCALPELSKNKLTKTEYNFIVKYLDIVLHFPIELYPNLQ